VQIRHTEEDVDRKVVLDDVRRAMAEVYGYLLHRCGSKQLAEDLTSESVLAAVDQVTSGQIDRISVAYVVGIARHKLVDHWRQIDREQRHLVSMVRSLGRSTDYEQLDAFEPGRAAVVLRSLSPMHRAALTLRYVDDLTVPTVAELLGRSVESTETLLMRAKRAFRASYLTSTEHGDD
jgi:RNA polymerase sigma-70 factor (ECF subfamily)